MIGILENAPLKKGHFDFLHLLWEEAKAEKPGAYLPIYYCAPPPSSLSLSHFYFFFPFLLTYKIILTLDF